MSRDWNTPQREPWNVLIHQALCGVDRHNRELLRTGDPRHAIMAQQLRQYVNDLKTWIHQQENNEQRT
jgi:hypothetical protein